MIEFTDDEIRSITSAVLAKLEDLQSVYKRNVNSRPDYAQSIARCMNPYLRVIERIHPGYKFVTFSPSLEKFLYGDSKLEVL